MGHGPLEQHDHEQGEDGVVPVLVEAPKRDAEDLEEEEGLEELVGEEGSDGGDGDGMRVGAVDCRRAGERRLRAVAPPSGVEVQGQVGRVAQGVEQGRIVVGGGGGGGGSAAAGGGGGGGAGPDPIHVVVPPPRPGGEAAEAHLSELQSEHRSGGGRGRGRGCLPSDGDHARGGGGGGGGPAAPRRDDQSVRRRAPGQVGGGESHPGPHPDVPGARQAKGDVEDQGEGEEGGGGGTGPPGGRGKAQGGRPGLGTGAEALDQDQRGVEGSEGEDVEAGPGRAPPEGGDGVAVAGPQGEAASSRHGFGVGVEEGGGERGGEPNVDLVGPSSNAQGAISRFRGAQNE